MKLSRVIFDNIEFKTPQLKSFLDRVNKEEFNEILTIGDTTYSMGTGGLHSQDIPMEIWSTSDYGCNGIIPCPSPTGKLQKAERLSAQLAALRGIRPLPAGLLRL
jgi:hypothetical protein